MRVRAVRTFVWEGRDVDLGDEFDVTPREAFILSEGYGYAVVLGEAPPAPSVMVTTADANPQYTDPLKRARRR